MKKSNSKAKPLLQGDVSWHPISEFPKGLKKLEFTGRHTVQHGESGNEHVLIGEKQSIELYKDEATGMHFIRVLKPIEMRHVRTGETMTSEHEPVTFAETYYEQKQEIEYDPFERILRRVQD